MINTIILGNALIELPKLPSGIANCVVTSPPYWGLRDYGVEPVIWDGDKNCKHEWGNPINRKMTGGKESAGTGTHKSGVGHFNNNSNFCLKCGAWRGSLGLEPTFELYIKHLCDIFDEVKRVLRRDGTCWVNIGDTYNSHSAKSKNVGGFEGKQMRNNKAYSDSKIALKKVGVPDKSLCDIPYRFSIEMINRGWIKRNTLIWHKPNCMPSSANDRFTIDFEYLFFFTKNNKAIFWTNEKTLECVSKKPLGTKGIEGKDWEWRETQNWKEEENAGYKIGATDPHRAASIGGLKLGTKHKKSGKLKKVSLWTGHDYWFEQQFEEYAPDTLPRMERGVNVNKWTFGADGQTPHNLSQPRLNKKYEHKAGHRDWQSGMNIRGKDAVIKLHPELGRNKRCVWIIPTQPFPEAHFAVYPEGLIEIPIKAGCPEFICKKCGMARVKILELTEEYKEYLGKGNLEEHHAGQEIKTKFKIKANAEYKFRGYSDCGCNAGFESGIVLDPFMGAGTSALVALKQRKRFIGIEIKQEYIDMSYKRIAKVQQRIF